MSGSSDELIGATKRYKDLFGWLINELKYDIYPIFDNDADLNNKVCMKWIVSTIEGRPQPR